MCKFICNMLITFNCEIFQGKGQMKTYWLLGRDPTENSQAKCPFGSILLEELSKVKSPDVVFSAETVKHEGPNQHSDYTELRQLYSPVSFEDVRRTINSSHTTTPVDSPRKHVTLRVEDAEAERSDGNAIQKDNGVVIIKNNILNTSEDTNKMEYMSYQYGRTSKTCHIV